MKNLIIAAIAVFSFGVASAQDSAIKVNPLAFFGGSDLISYERKLSDHGTGLIGVGYSSFSLGNFKYTNAGAELQYRYYFTQAMKGWYGGGQAGYNSGKVEVTNFLSSPGNTSNDNDFNSFRVGAKGGYQWQWTSGFTLDLNIGFAYNKFSYDNNSGQFAGLKGTSVAPNLGLALGYSF
jgi:hypothetical protein